MRHPGVVPALALVCVLSGCRCGDEPPPIASECVRDPELLGAASSCVRDEHCPCGASCDLGRCVAGCATADDCDDGERCDDYGRCRPATATALTPRPAAELDGALAVPSMIRLADDGTAVVPVEVVGRDLARARVTATHGAVACAEGAVAAEVCELTAVPAGTIVELAVTRSAAAADDEVTTLLVVTAGQRLEISLPLHGQVLGDPDLAERQPVSGAYDGVGALTATGIGGGGGSSAPPGPVEVPFQVRVWGGDAGSITVAIDDPLGALTSAGALIGTATLAQGSSATVYEGTVTFPAQPYADGSLREEGWQAIAVVTEAFVSFDTAVGVATITVTEELHGLGLIEPPWARWQIGMARADDVDGAAPSVPAAATLSYSEDARQAQPTPWEAAVAGRFAGYAAQPESARRAAWHHLFDGEPRTLDACYVPDAAVTASFEDARRFYLGATVGLGGSPATLAARQEAIPRGLSHTYVPGATLLAVEIVGVHGYATAQPDPSLVPCNYGMYAFDVGLPSGARLRRDPLNIENTCTQLRERTGCEIVNVPSAVLGVDVTLQVTHQVGASAPVVETVRLVVEGAANRYCRLPPTPLHCAEGLACVEPVESTAPGSALAPAFGADLLPTSGDARCDTGARTAAIELDAAADAPAPEQRPIAADAFEACLDELAAMRDGALPSTTRAYAAGLHDLLQAGTCLDAVRTIAAAMHALDNDRRGAPSGHELRTAATAYGHRLLARWLELHAFFAAEAVQRERVADLFRGGGGTPPITLDQALDASLAGWDLLLLPRTGRALGNAPDDALLAPDYRLAIPGAIGRDKDAQRAGLLVSMLDTLAHQAALLDRMLEERLRGFDQDALDAVGRVLPRFVLARAIAHGLADRVATAAPDWLGRFEAADRRALTTLAQALARARALAEGRNPLGIEDADLPLYFLADELGGPGGRFAAVSDFLLGTGPGSSAWAPTLVRQAQEAEAAAQEAYLDAADRQFRYATTDQQMEIFIGDVEYEYELLLRDYCGPTSGSLLGQEDFNAASCFFLPDPQCRTDLGDYYRLHWRPADFQGQMCVHRLLGGSGFGFSQPATVTFYDRCHAGGAAPTFTVGSCPAGSESPVCLRCSTDAAAVLPLTLATFQMTAPPPTPGLQPLQRAIGACAMRHPGFRAGIPVPARRVEAARCVQGTLGEGALTIVAANRDVQLARAEYAELQASYAIAMASCHLIARRNQSIDAVTAAFNQRMRDLSIAKQAVDTAGAAAQLVSDCAATAAGSSNDTPWGAAAGAVATGISCAAGGVATAAEIASIGIETVMDNAVRSHDAELAMLENQAELAVCYNDARQELVGQAAAAIRVQQALFDLDRAQASQLERIREAQLHYQEGADYVAYLGESRIAPPSGDPWLDERVNLYAARMRQARRAVYLAVRAVEYEFQASLAERDQALAAETPDELEAVLTSLWAAAGTRGINGSRPSDLHVVISLRDDVLRLGDRDDLPDGFRTMTPAERFREVLQAHAYASYDDEGRYEGQRIPFTLAPLGALGLDTGGVPIYATTDCAERLWSVNASVQGEAPWEGSDTSFVRIDLLKQNSFFSQWCGEPGPDDPAFQIASVRPARNLFREPGVGATVGGDLGIAQGEREHSRARIQAYFNVSRTELEDAQYANGETSELAARGLFGEYALFIPAEMIAREASGGGYTDGLVLDRIEDILLRLDYVSVAKP